MRQRYLEQLALLHGEMVEMGGLCEEAISLAIQALTKNERELIDKVFDVDAQIDRKERSIEALCLKLLLQQQPVATDLREISSALKMISDMERIGDQASDIAEITRSIPARADASGTGIRKMAEEAIKMVTDSVDSFVKRDLSLARSVIAYDDVVDDWFDRVKTRLIERISADNTQSESCVDLLMVAKYLERIGDHATNIAEWVEFSITGARSKDGVFPAPEE